jgi:hypothetical protein
LQKKLDEMIASGASPSEIKMVQTEMRRLQHEINGLQDDINESVEGVPDVNYRNSLISEMIRNSYYYSDDSNCMYTT